MYKYSVTGTHTHGGSATRYYYHNDNNKHTEAIKNLLDYEPYTPFVNISVEVTNETSHIEVIQQNGYSNIVYALFCYCISLYGNKVKMPENKYAQGYSKNRLLADPETRYRPEPSVKHYLNLTAGNNKIEAVKFFRLKYDLSLIEAKRLYEVMFFPIPQA